MKKIKSPQDIYPLVLKEVEELMTVLKDDCHDKAVNQYRKEALQKLDGVRQKLKSNIQSLKNNLEWNVFTIAFYGETNAGKSTLIETLRIILKEEKKTFEQERFLKVKQSIDCIDEEISQIQIQLDEVIEELNKETVAKKSKLNDLEDQIQTQLEKIKLLSCEITNLRESIREKTRKNLWLLIKRWFYQLEEQKQIKKNSKVIAASNKQIKQHKAEQNQVTKHYIQLEKNFQKQMQTLKVKLAKQTKKKIPISKKLDRHSDGAIIGNGQSDYTRNVNEYLFNIGDKKLAILDLPGIEGKELAVQDEINKAVKKAHVVCYVSKKCAPPQKGDEENLGTIEKISQQLSKHSEVYFIYNKPILNPRQLKAQLLNNSEIESLKEVDTVLKKVLNKNYQGHQLVSAYPAFLSVGLYNSEELKKSREKFLSVFGDNESFGELSNVMNFSDWLTKDLASNMKRKIIRSNYKKLIHELENTNSQIKEVYQNFAELSKNLNRSVDECSNQIEGFGYWYEKKIDNIMCKNLQSFRTELRKKIYVKIDKGIKKQELEAVVNEYVKKEIEILMKKTEGELIQLDSEFKKQVLTVIDQHQKYFQEILAHHIKKSSFEFDFNPIISLDIKTNFNGIVGSAITSITGIVITIINANNPFGWFMIACSVASLIFNMYRQIRAYFDANYLKAQQRKIVDENIEKVSQEIKGELDRQMNEVHYTIGEVLEKIQDKVKSSTVQVETMTDTIKSINVSMENLKYSVIQSESESIEYENSRSL